MKINKKIIALTITSITISVNCQDLNLVYSDGSVSLPLESSSTMSVNPVTGDINVETSQSAEQIGSTLGLQPVGNPPNISFQVTLGGSAESATINATISEEAVYCQKSGLWGTATISSNPPTTFVTSVAGTAISNSSDYTLTCGNSFGKTIEGTTVTGIVASPVVSISATPTNVDIGGDSTVTWSATNNPDTCTFTGDWPANITKDGPFSFVETNITASKTYSVLCDNAAVGDSGTETATITLNGQSAWPSCSGANTYILNGNEDRTVLANNSSNPDSYDGNFSSIQGAGSNNPWPNFGDLIRLSLDKNKYIAAKFTTNSTGYDAKFVFSGTGNFEGQTPGAATYVISTCPGSFDTGIGARCKVGGGSLFWSTKDIPGGPPGYFCELEKNTTYYLNMVHSDNSEGNNYGTSDCGASYCGILGKNAGVSF